MDNKPLLRDAGIEPTNEVIAVALGTAYDAYAKLTEETAKHEIEVGWRFYKDGNAWLGKSVYKWITSRGTPKEITVFWLSIWDGFFRVGFNFPEKYRAEILGLPLGQETKAMIEGANQTGRSFSLSFDLKTDELFQDIFTLAEYKKAKK